MFLFDLRLRFARDLIGHWLDIRKGALVPFEADIDPRALLPSLPQLAILDLTQPTKIVIEQAGRSLRHRFGSEILHMNWIDFVPPMLGDAGERARLRIQREPSGYYHKFMVALDGCDNLAVETLVLPLRRRNASLPHAVIGMTREIEKNGTCIPAGWLAPSSHIAHYVMDFVDICNAPPG